MFFTNIILIYYLAIENYFKNVKMNQNELFFTEIHLKFVDGIKIHFLVN